MSWVLYFIRRAGNNIKREPLLNGATVLTLAVAFLCFCAFLVVAFGLGSVVSRWADDYHISVYLAEDVSEEDARQIAATFEDLTQVDQATLVTSTEMREQLLSELGDEQLVAGLDQRLFPMSIEVQLSDDVRGQAPVAALAERLSALAVVEQVETYGDLFAKLKMVSVIARTVSIVLGIIVLLATMLIISNTVRLSLLGRREEIEIMKLCGATDRFVRVPFLITGALHGFLGAIISLGLLMLAGGLLLQAIGTIMPVLAPPDVAGLPIVAAVVVVLTGTVLGLLGSHLSVNRFLQEAP